MRTFGPRLRAQRFWFEAEPGVVIPSDLEDYTVRWIFIHGLESDCGYRLSRRMVRPNDIVVDVGANIGTWLMGIARRLGPRGKVYAFEPDPANCARLGANLSQNGLTDKVVVQQCALSDHSGPLTLFRPSYNNSGHGTLGKRPGVETAVSIEGRTLDEYLAIAGIDHVDLLKSDVEGAEWFVFRGAQRLLSRADAPILQFEVNEETAANLGHTCAEVKELLIGYGYKLFGYDGRHLTRVAVDRIETPGDLFAFKPNHYSAHPWLEGLCQ